jgi:hypothetical protein
MSKKRALQPIASNIFVCVHGFVAATTWHDGPAIRRKRANKYGITSVHAAMGQHLLLCFSIIFLLLSVFVFLLFCF